MPKMKTKSGAKKRFKFTASGKIKTHQVGKRHRLINNSPARTRDLPGTAVLSSSETQRVKRRMVLLLVTRSPFRAHPCAPQEGFKGGKGLLGPPQEQYHLGERCGRSFDA